MKTTTTKNETPRQRLLSSRLASGRTMQQLFEGWGFRFDAAGYIVPARESSK